MWLTSQSTKAITLHDEPAMRLYLDDIRVTPTGFDYRAYTATEAITLLSDGGITFISFDHDLGPASAGTGYQVACWIERQVMTGQMQPITFAIHSGNPVGAANIRDAMRRVGTEIAQAYPNGANMANVVTISTLTEDDAGMRIEYNQGRVIDCTKVGTGELCIDIAAPWDVGTIAYIPAEAMPALKAWINANF